jgi:hypothetical protein
MIVVADSGPLHYLILLEHVDLLRRFYGQVLVRHDCRLPENVRNLNHRKAYRVLVGTPVSRRLA